MSKLFTIGGTSVLNGTTTFRFATGEAKVRAAKLKRHDHTDIVLYDLPSAMTKEDAINWLVKEKGMSAVLPTNRKDKPVELTPEQQAEAAKAAARELANAKRREARAAAKAAQVAAEDANFVAGMTGGDTVEVPSDVVDNEAVVEGGSEQVAEAAVDVEAGVDELMDALGEQDGEQPEMGVDGERAAAVEVAGE